MYRDIAEKAESLATDVGYPLVETLVLMSRADSTIAERVPLPDTDEVQHLREVLRGELDSACTNLRVAQRALAYASAAAALLDGLPDEDELVPLVPLVPEEGETNATVADVVSDSLSRCNVCKCKHPNHFSWCASGDDH